MKTIAQDLFVQAHELPAADRENFLREACGDNAELHLEFQRLLNLLFSRSPQPHVPVTMMWSALFWKQPPAK